MAASPGSSARASFDLKSATLPLISVVLRSADGAALAQEVERRLAEQADFFDQDPVLVDLSQLPPDNQVDFAGLVRALRRLRVLPVGVRGARPDQIDAARAAGLTEAPEVALPRAVPAPAPAAAATPAVPVAPQALPTMVIERPLRSGQQVYARNADLIVMAAVSNGAEVIADGNVHVYAPLRGKAIAGARGNAQARIFATCMQPELVSIAGIYRTAETPLPPEIQGRAAKISLVGEKLVIEPLQ